MAFKILAIDGGGVRGIYPAHILLRIKQEFGINFFETFDLIVGTSTGSIIAAALAVDYPIEKIVALYKDKAAEIFGNKKLNLLSLYQSKYGKSPLETLLSQTLGDLTLSQTKTRLVIPATDISNGTVYVFKSSYLPEFVRDNNTKIKDAVLASCSAPTYFDPTVLNTYLLADGGLWANNPSLVAITEAMGKLKINAQEVRVLSLGTGIGHKYYDPHNAISKKWGLLTAWEHRKLINTILNLQSVSSENVTRFLLPPENYLRLNFESDNDLALDDNSQVSSFEAKADKTFTYKSADIKKLILE